MAKKLSPLEQRSSKKVLDDLKKQTGEMLKGKMDGLKKVTVASDSPEGLAHGLELAKKIAGKHELPEDELDESPEEELEESPEEEHSEELHGEEDEDEHLSPEEIDAKIEHLLALKHAKHLR
jgi:hypothetical protein